MSDSTTTQNDVPMSMMPSDAVLAAACPKPRNMRFWIVSGVCLGLLCMLLLYLWLSSISPSSAGVHSHTKRHPSTVRWNQQSSISGMYKDPSGNMIILVTFRNGLVCISKVHTVAKCDVTTTGTHTTPAQPEVQFSLNGLPAVQMSDANRFVIPDQAGTIYFSWDGEHALTVTVQPKNTQHGDCHGKTFVLRRIPIQEASPA